MVFSAINLLRRNTFLIKNSGVHGVVRFLTVDLTVESYIRNVLENRVFSLLFKSCLSISVLIEERSIELVNIYSEYHDLLHWTMSCDYVTTLIWYGKMTWPLLSKEEIIKKISHWFKSSGCITYQTFEKFKAREPFENEEISMLIWNLNYLFPECPIPLPNIYYLSEDNICEFWSTIRRIYIVEHRDDHLACYVDYFYNKWYLKEKIYSFDDEDIDYIKEHSLDDLYELLVRCNLIVKGTEEDDEEVVEEVYEVPYGKYGQ